LAGLAGELKEVNALQSALEGEVQEASEHSARKKEEAAALERSLDKKRSQEVTFHPVMKIPMVERYFEPNLTLTCVMHNGLT